MSLLIVTLVIVPIGAYKYYKFQFQYNLAFNALNRNAALRNIRIVCPELSTYVINSYREPARLFISQSDREIMSQEGVTQGDNAAMGFYACATIPVIFY